MIQVHVQLLVATWYDNNNNNDKNHVEVWDNRAQWARLGHNKAQYVCMTGIVTIVKSNLQGSGGEDE